MALHSGGPEQVHLTAQKRARHSTPMLTAARHTHIDLQDQHKEVQKLPSLELGRKLGRTIGSESQKTSPIGMTDGGEPDAKLGGKSRDNPDISSEIERREGDSNPRYPCGQAGFQDRCNQPLCHPSEEPDTAFL